ncbi:DUF1534 domain-containing protein [Pseudomonas syringae pv. dysoxyli]|nr:DUF1534 domain-containing protein [Pseudomonas syringae pv. dysoxyli]
MRGEGSKIDSGDGRACAGGIESGRGASRAWERSVSFRHLSFRTLRHGNAVLDALRHLLPSGISRSSSGSHCHPPPRC